MLPVFTTEQIKNGTGTGDLMIDLSDYMKKQDAATKTDITTLTEILANKLDATPQHKHDIANVKDLREELDSKYDTSKQYSYNVILSDSEKIPYLEAPRVGKLDISCNEGRDGYVFYVDDKSGDLMITLNDVLIGSYSIAAGKWNFDEYASADHTHNEYASTDHTHTTFNEATTFNKQVRSNEFASANDIAAIKIGGDYMTIQTYCNSGGGLFVEQMKNDKKTVRRRLNLIDGYGNTEFPGKLTVNGATTLKGDVTMNNNLTVKGTDVLTKISEIETILKNHYDAILLLCQKHGMIDGDGDDGSNISPTDD